MASNLIQTAEQLVKFAKQNGADQVQVSIGNSTRFSASVRENEIESLKNTGSTGLSIKIIKDGKVAYASSSDLSDGTLKRIAKNAIERAPYGSEDPFSALPDSQAVNATAEALKLYDPSIKHISPDESIKKAKHLEKITMADKRMTRSGGVTVGHVYGQTILVNSNGFSDSYDSSGCYIGVYGQAGKGDNIFEDGWHDSSITAKGLMSPEEISKVAIHRTTRLIGARKINTQNVPIVMEAPIASSILGFLTECLSGGNIFMNRSYLAGKLNQQVANKNINIIDNGILPGRPGSSPFDSEGVPTRRTEIITNGMLKNYLLSTYSARKLKMQSTGNASGATNFYMEPGNSTVKDMIKSVEKGLFLTKTIGQGTVATSGDISKGAYGIWIENGELTYPVSEITFSGNLSGILNGISMVGNDLNERRSVTAPSFKVDEMTISGK